MLFSKKNKGASIIHYEGLQGFKQDIACNVILNDDAVVFTNAQGSSASLKYNQIQSLDFLSEVQFMGQYHNNPVSTARVGAKWFGVIKYISSTGDNRYLAFWCVDSKIRNLFKDIEPKLSVVNQQL